MTITTNRLTLRPFAHGDAAELLAVFRDADVRRYLLDDTFVTAEWVEQEITASESRFADCGVGLWAVRRRGDDTIVGFAGFREFFDPPQLQLLYGFLPRYWGHGLATEAASAACDHAFRYAGWAEIKAATDAPNRASMNVLRRLRMHVTHRSELGAAGTVFFAVDRDTWAAAQRQPSRAGDHVDDRALFTKFWTDESKTTRNVLARIPEGSDYRPDPKSRTAQEIAWQIVCEEKMIIDALETGKAEWAPPPTPKTMKEVVDTYDKQSATMTDRWSALPADRWNGMLEFFGQPRPASPMAWSFLFDIVHHRGQITTYLRPMGSTVPQIYGPSADEP